MSLHWCMLVVVMVFPACDGQSCTLDAIRSFQGHAVIPIEKVDGRWYVNKAYGYPETAGYTWYTLDTISTTSGLAYISNKRLKDGTCVYPFVDTKSTANSAVYTTEASPKKSYVAAAWDSEVKHVVVYQCASEMTAPTDQCLNPIALLTGKEYNPQAASQWLASVNSSSLPCFENSQGIVIQKGRECPLKQMLPRPGHNCAVSSFPIQQNFNLLKYVSKPWKEMAWLAASYIPASEFYQNYVHTYTIRPDQTVLCDVKAKNPKEGDKCLNYQINMTVTSTPGKLIFHDPKGDMPYNVIHVDYDHFALVYGCVRVDNASGVCRMGRGWVWSRSASLERRYRLQANSLILDLCVNPAAWFPTTHADPCTSGAGDKRSSVPFAVALTALLLSIIIVA